MKIKVMIVDDQVILSEGIRSVLSSSEDLEVIALATDGQDALERMAQGCIPDVVLLDIRMPNMNGVVTTGEIKKQYPEVPSITAHADTCLKTSVPPPSSMQSVMLTQGIRFFLPRSRKRSRTRQKWLRLTAKSNCVAHSGFLTEKWKSPL